MRFGLGALLFLLPGFAAGLFAAPSLTGMAPRGFPAGARTELALSGSNLQPGTLWTSSGIEFAVTNLGPATARLHFELPVAIPVGIYAARLFASNGVSNLLPFMVDDLPTVAATNDNTTVASAQFVPAVAAVEGSVHELRFSWFKFHAERKQFVSIEIVAARLGSRLDSVLRVVDAKGREIGYNDDAPGLRADSHLSFTAPETGEYFIELRDVNYGGGTEFHYRLRIGSFPLVTTTFPLAIQGDTATQVELLGPRGTAGASGVSTDTNHAAASVAVAGERGSVFARAIVSTAPEVIEREPDNVGSTAMRITVPCGLNGRFATKNDRDCYQFTAAAGEKLTFRAQTRSLGAPCDVALQLESTNGERLARSNLGAADEGMLTHSFEHDSVCRLIVTEATGATGPALNYHISIERAAGFTLAADTETVQAKAGGSFDLSVTCSRPAYKGAIELWLAGAAAADLSVSNNIIPAGKTNVAMKVHVPATWVPGIPRHVSILGRESGKDRAATVRASTLPALRNVWPQLLHLPPGFDGAIAIGIHND